MENLANKIDSIFTYKAKLTLKGVINCARFIYVACIYTAAFTL